jgi:hypothetical protein
MAPESPLDGSGSAPYAAHMSDRKERLAARLEAQHQQAREEQTTSGNAGGFEVPIGGVQRDAFPSTVGMRKRKRKGWRKDALGAIDRYEIPDGYAKILTRATEQLERLRS